MGSKRKFLWVTDPWETLDHERDTTLRLAHEAVAQGHQSFWCDVRSIRFEQGKVWADAAPVSESNTDFAPPFPLRQLDPRSFWNVHYRVDPPVDLAYLQPLQLLALCRAKVINPSSVLLIHNEKTEAALLEGLMPDSIVSSRWEDLARFGKAHPKTVLKPLHQAQSKGVALLAWGSPAEVDQSREVLSLSTEQFTRPVILQQYLTGIVEGEQRLWFLDGKLLACVRKMPLQNDFRVDIDRGSSLVPTKLSAKEKKAAVKIGAFLRRSKIRLAAVDLIDGLVTDFNFTSPGLITQMERVLEKNLAKPIIKALASRSGL